MAYRTRTQTPSCGELLAIVFAFGGLRILAPLAVQRWGMIAFVLILVTMVAASFGLVRTGWMRRKGEGIWMMLVLMSAITTSDMTRALGTLCGARC